MNNDIEAPKVRLIGESGEQLGIVTLEAALEAAEEANLDLVEIAPNADPPVCKILGFGKYRYEKQKRIKQNRKKQHVIQVKEIRLRPSIDEHDLQTKIKKAKKFIEEGSKLRFTVLFRGREMARMEVGTILLEKVAEILQDVAKVEKVPETEGRRMILIMAPK
ncbi:MAG: translation initiation factor IF-3 [Fidelibacterota bacterium]